MTRKTRMDTYLRGSGVVLAEEPQGNEEVRLILLAPVSSAAASDTAPRVDCLAFATSRWPRPMMVTFARWRYTASTRPISMRRSSKWNVSCSRPHLRSGGSFKPTLPPKSRSGGLSIGTKLRGVTFLVTTMHGKIVFVCSAML